jgi:RimJ/RimL family protein N-acetyltransferase
VVLETNRLVLRRLSPDDAAFILELLNDPAWLRFIGDRGVRTPEDARAYILRSAVASYARLGFGLYLTVRKADDVPIGICGLLKRQDLADVEVGFALLPRFWAQGYAFEAAAATMDYGWSVLGLRRIAAVTVPGNDRSIRLLEKLGLRFEKMIRLSPDAPEVKLFAAEAPPAAGAIISPG